MAREKRVVLAAFGLTQIAPIAMTDLTLTILALLFGQRSGVFYLATPSRTELSLIRQLQQLDPLITLDFSAVKHTARSTFIPATAEQLVTDTTALPKQLHVALQSDQTHLPIQPKKRIRSPQQTAFLKRLVTICLTLIFLPIVLYGVGLSFGYAGVGLAAFFLEKGDLAKTETIASSSRLAFSLAAPSEQMGIRLGRNLGGDLTPRSFSVANGQTAAELLVNLSSSLHLMTATLRGEKTIDEGTLMLHSRRAMRSLQLLEAQEVLPESYREKLRLNTQSASILTTLFDNAPSLLGLSGKKTYAILLQNNMELRSGGGFITAFALLSLERGHLTDFTIYDVHDADEKLKGHVDPPFLLGRYMSASHLYLRDSNVSLDSAENATMAAKLLQLETGVSVDGVMTVDLSFLKKLLAITGPVTVPQYKTTVTQATMYQQVQEHLIPQFAPQQVGKGEFIQSFANALLTTLFSRPASPFTIARNISDAVLQKHLLFTSLDPALQPLLLRNHFASSPELITAPDSLSLVENNIGANSANYFLKRTIRQRVQLQPDNTASESVRLEYTNTASDDSGNNDYEAYVQLVLPQTATLSAVYINGTKQQVVSAVTDQAVYTKATFSPPKGFEVTTEKEGDKTVYGFYLTVQATEEKEVRLEYSVGSVVHEEGQRASYHLAYSKQPGVEEDEYELTLLYPKNYRPVRVPQETEKRQSSLQITTALKEDQDWMFDFTAQ
jgi:hypothetical protein